MERVIRGKRYNTATAEAVAEREHLYPSDFGWVHEILYKKRTGEFFLWGEGGPQSKYRKKVEKNVYCSGEKIKPLTIKEAKAFIETYAPEEYKKLFTIDVWDDETVPLNIYLPTPTFQRLKIASVKKGESMTKLVSKLIDENL